MPHCFLDTAEVDDEARPDVFNTLPDALQAEWGNLLINTRYRFVLYHTKKPIRVKAAKHFGDRLTNTTPYFRTIRDRDSNTPLPTAPRHIIDQCQTLLTKCREVFLGRRRPYNPQHFHPFVTSFGLEALSFVGPGALPAGPIPQDPASPPVTQPPSTSAFAPPTATLTPPAQATASAPPLPDFSYTFQAAASSPASSLPTPPAAVPTARTNTPLPSVPPPPAPPADMEVEPVEAPSALRAASSQGLPPLPPPTTFPPVTGSSPPSPSPRLPATPDSMEVDTSRSLPSATHDTLPHQPVDDDTKRMLIAPLVIPSRSPKPSSLPTTTSAEKQSLLTCYAGLFARLPSLGQIMNSQFLHAQELYNHLFAPSTPVADPDNPNPAFHQSTPPRDSITPISSPFSDLVDSFVDLPSSLEDVHNMSRPTAPPLTLFNPSTQQPDPTFNFPPLLQFLADTLNPHLTFLASQPTHSCFVILVVGPSTHSMAGPALHTLTWSALSPLYREMTLASSISLRI